MKLLRSWPATIPDDRIRGHVVDAIPKLVIDNHHYGPLGDVQDDVLLLEWDVAVGQDDLRRFAHEARKHPDRVLVAPYRIYADTYGLPVDIWCHRHWDGTGMGTINPEGAKPVHTGDPYCQLFALGMAYLPWWIVRAFLLGRFAAHFNDTNFSMWHYEHIQQDVRICWPVRPVHLNYVSLDLEGPYG